MKKKNLILHFIILPLFIAELISRGNNIHSLEYIIKPWLLIWIAVYYYVNSRKSRKDLFVYMAFIFSWIGDMFLMLAHKNGMYFYIGVGAFFFAQLSYIKVFAGSIKSNNKGFLMKQPAWLLPFALYLGSILYLIIGGMKGVMIPVIIIYSLSLISMSVLALNRKSLVNEKSFLTVFTGSVLFVLSDSMIAIGKFYSDFSQSSFLIMLTYFSAQYLIMLGLIEEDKR